MVNSTNILIGLTIVGLLIISIMSINTISQIALTNSQVNSTIRMTPEQYFGGAS